MDWDSVGIIAHRQICRGTDETIRQMVAIHNQDYQSRSQVNGVSFIPFQKFRFISPPSSMLVPPVKLGQGRMSWCSGSALLFCFQIWQLAIWLMTSFCLKVSSRQINVEKWSWMMRCCYETCLDVNHMTAWWRHQMDFFCATGHLLF